MKRLPVPSGRYEIPSVEDSNVTHSTSGTTPRRSQHAALWVGDLKIVSTGNRALYSILRLDREEATLVLVNLSPNTVTAYGLSLEGSSLPAGTYAVNAIMGDGSFAPLSVSASGGFSGYIPIREIPPYGTYILQLVPGGS